MTVWGKLDRAWIGGRRRRYVQVFFLSFLFCVLPSVYICICVKGREGKGRKGDKGNGFEREREGGRMG